MPPSSPSDSVKSAIAGLDRCVYCGLCNATCPTYRLDKVETESPRGRIAMMRAHLTGTTALSTTSSDNIAHCLSCRTCESVCPAGVPYGAVLRTFRQETGLRLPRWLRLLLVLVSERKLISGAARLHRFARSVPLLARLLPTPLQTQLNASDALHSAKWRWQAWQPLYGATQTPARGSVDLFLGCIADIVDQPTTTSAIRVLNAMGLDVRIPAEQTCCGGLAQQTGWGDATALAVRNQQAFAPNSRPIVSLTTGCTSVLKDYAVDKSDSWQVVDFCQFVLAETQSHPLNLRPRPGTAALFVPCSGRHPLRITKILQRLLALIPDLKVVTLPPDPACCGAAGTYVLTEPARATALRDQILDLPELNGVSMLVTPNVGCAMHLAAGLKQRNRSMRILHPAALLAEQLSEGVKHDNPKQTTTAI